MKRLKHCLHILKTVLNSIQYIFSFLLFKPKKRISVVTVVRAILNENDDFEIP